MSEDAPRDDVADLDEGDHSRLCRLLVDHFPSGIVFLFDRDFRYRLVGGEGIELLDLTRESMQGQTLSEVFPPEMVDTIRPHYEAALAGESTTFDVGYGGRSFHVRMLPVERDGEVVYGMGIAEDVTEHQRSERELQETATAMRQLYDVTTDREATFEEKVRRMLDLGRDRLGLPYGFLTSIEEGQQTVVFGAGDHELLQPGETCPLSQAYCRRTVETDGLLVVADAVAEGWVDDPAYETFGLGSYVGVTVPVAGELYGTLCFAADDPHEEFTETERSFVRLLAELVSYELERERAEASLRRQNERLEQFAGVVSHDLRNPLNVVQGTIDLVQETGDLSHLDRAARAAERMNELIDDLLTLAQQGEDVTEPTVVSLPAVAREAWEVVASPSASLVVETDRALLADEGRLQQLLENLFRNSVEHGGEEVTVTVGVLPDGFYVEDDGEGFEDDPAELFEPGYTTSAEGTGFGLSIVQQIAGAHGWEVTADESDAGGARFEFTGVKSEGESDTDAPPDRRDGNDAEFRSPGDERAVDSEDGVAHDRNQS